MNGSRASVVINNYNYGRYLATAIDSALDQTYEDVEVIVVDDGSTDESRSVIESYRDRVKPRFCSNGGQGAALNAGFAASTGDVVLFLDADDALVHTACQAAAEALDGTSASLVHWPMIEIDEEGRQTGALRPQYPQPRGDLRAHLLQHGPALNVTPTSGNAWRRSFLAHVMPIPPEGFRLCADAYLFVLAAADAEIVLLPRPQAMYRVHGKNLYSGQPAVLKWRQDLEIYKRQCALLQEHFRTHGVTKNLEWGESDYEKWLHSLIDFRGLIEAKLPRGATVVLVDADELPRNELLPPDRRFRDLVEADGVPMGAPVDSASAVKCLEAARASGAEFLVLAWTAAWYRDVYPGLIDHLDDLYGLLTVSPTASIYDLRTRRAGT